MQSLLERNPIAAWIGGKGTGNRPFFAYRDHQFGLSTPASEERAEALQGLTREIVEWRLASYIRRITAGTAASRFEAVVDRSGTQVIVRLPSRASIAGMPDGTTEVRAEGTSYRAHFLRDSVHLLTAPDSGDNLLPTLLGGWFGAEAGVTGHADHLVFELRDGTYEMRPMRAGESVLAVGQTYDREQIPPLFGTPFNSGFRQTGVIHLPASKKLLFIVTLSKVGMQKEHRYADRFESRDEFKWQSQNRTAPTGSIGRIITGHAELGYEIHLFIRRVRTHDGEVAPFVYCGQLLFLSTEGSKPMNVTWRLITPLSDSLARTLGVP